MGQRVGLIAGGGDFPLQALLDAKRRNIACVVAGLRGAASAALEDEAEAFAWFEPRELDKMAAFFKSHGVRSVVMFGKIEHRTIFEDKFPAEALAPFLLRLADHSPTALLKALVGYLQAGGLEVLDPAAFLEPYFCSEGVLGKVPLSAEAAAAVDFGWPLAKILADADIGQTLAVKGRAVVAVEGMEGTDEAVRRAAGLAGDGIVVLKVGRTVQDLRLDVPAVGLTTVRTLVAARAAALVIEAGRVPFFQKEEALEAAAEAGLAVWVKR